MGNISPNGRSRCVRRLEHAVLPACALARSRVLMPMSIAAPVTLATLSRRALLCVTGCTSLADIKMNRVELIEKDTCNGTIVSALVACGVQRPRTA